MWNLWNKMMDRIRLWQSLILNDVSSLWPSTSLRFKLIPRKFAYSCRCLRLLSSDSRHPREVRTSFGAHNWCSALERCQLHRLAVSERDHPSIEQRFERRTELYRRHYSWQSQELSSLASPSSHCWMAQWPIEWTRSNWSCFRHRREELSCLATSSMGHSNVQVSSTADTINLFSYLTTFGFFVLVFTITS